jgi:hypothetical protein
MKKTLKISLFDKYLKSSFSLMSYLESASEHTGQFSHELMHRSIKKLLKIASVRDEFGGDARSLTEHDRNH